MICKDCKHVKKLANTNECGDAICGYPTSFFPININDECHYTPAPYTCGDCSHFLDGDPACFTCRKEDSAYHNGKLCWGFIDSQADNIYKALVDWKLRGFDAKERLAAVVNEFESFVAPWEEK